ncbi:LuxR C-terminal-related transcriptional regulator [Kordia sp.]|uniref:response regulator transcription factor n=1 Tax=Kordia sp. TaxID=1965332 RepID=UPI003450D1FA
MTYAKGDRYSKAHRTKQKNKEIADIFFISVNTVQSHKKNLYSKLNIHSVSELVTQAFQHGFVET